MCFSNEPFYNDNVNSAEQLLCLFDRDPAKICVHVAMFLLSWF